MTNKELKEILRLLPDNFQVIINTACCVNRCEHIDNVFIKESVSSTGHKFIVLVGESA